jgi:hypothetical protein
VATPRRLWPRPRAEGPVRKGQRLRDTHPRSWQRRSLRGSPGGRGVILRLLCASMPYVSWVSSGAGEQAATAAQVVLATAPADDAGASTADRYDWQAAMAAADGLALYLDALDDGKLRAGEDARIVCEHHEDWVVVRGDDAELVSAKHREPGYAIFTTAGQLADDGGLAHLFGRWHALGEWPSCRLVTTAGLAPGPAQGLEKAATYLRDLRDAGHDPPSAGSDHEPAISGFARALRQHPTDLPGSWQAATGGSAAAAAGEQDAQVSRFLAALCIEHGKPSRAHVGHAAPSMYCAPVLERLSHDAGPGWRSGRLSTRCSAGRRGRAGAGRPDCYRD